jgi:hypothetical protein
MRAFGPHGEGIYVILRGSLNMRRVIIIDIETLPAESSAAWKLEDGRSLKEIENSANDNDDEGGA